MWQYILCGLLILLCCGGTLFASRFAFVALAHVEGYNFAEKATQKDNKAVFIQFGGIMSAMLIGTMMSHIQTGKFWIDLACYAEGFVMTLIAVCTGFLVNDLLILHGVRNKDEVVDKGNIAVAVVEAATSIATALIIAGSIRSIHRVIEVDHVVQFNAHVPYWNILGWFILGQAVFIGISKLYGLALPESFEEIEKKANVACALTLSGFLLSAGIMLSYALPTDTTFLGSLLPVGLHALTWIIMVAALHIGVNYILIPGCRLVHLIMDDQNWGAALVDSMLAVPFTIVLVQNFITRF